MKTKHLIGLLIHDGTDAEHHRLAITAVQIVDRDTKNENITRLPLNPTLRGVGDYMEDPMGGGLKDLQISAQLGREPRPINDALYGWSVRYREPYVVELRDAERMVKTLRTIHRKMEKVSGEMGRPESFGAYVVRVADAIGAKYIIRLTGGNGCTYDEGEYDYMTLDGGMDYINALERKWLAAIHKKEVA